MRIQDIVIMQDDKNNMNKFLISLMDQVKGYKNDDRLYYKLANKLLEANLYGGVVVGVCLLSRLEEKFDNFYKNMCEELCNANDYNVEESRNLKHLLSYCLYK